MVEPTNQEPFDDVIDAFDDEVQAIARALKSLIASVHGKFVEVVWPKLGIASYGVGPKKMSEHYAYIAPQTSYVNLGFYHGAALDDPSGLLEGAGKKLRHVKICTISDATTRELATLLKAALLERQTAVNSR